jgi:hypothetical protein
VVHGEVESAPDEPGERADRETGYRERQQTRAIFFVLHALCRRAL